MERKKRVILLVLASCLCAALLAGCGFFEFQKEKRELIRLASDQALAYVSDTYGGKAKVVDVEVGTYTVVFSAALRGDALVTVSLDGEEFQVYVDTREPQFCVDNRTGLALAQALDEYFRGLYGLPQALSHRVRIFSTDEDFFAHWTTNLGYNYNFLDFDYHGQPLEEVLPLLDKVYFEYDYVDDSVSLDNIELRDEDWGGSIERFRVWARCFRCYDEDSEIPVGIQVTKDRPVMMAEGMLFSKRGLSSYGTLSDIANALPHLSLRETLYFEKGKTTRQRYTITRMGNFWVTTLEGFTAEECYELRPCEPGWTDSIDLWSDSFSAYYTREEILDENTHIDIRKKLTPFLDARFQSEGEMLCLREGIRERIEVWWEERKGWSMAADKSPIAVTVIPSLVYQSDACMGAGRTRELDDGTHHAVSLFLSYLDQKDYWTHGLSHLTFYYPNDLVLLREVK